MKNLLFLLLIFVSVFCHAQEEEVKKYIKTESIGGKLDFSKAVDKEYSTALIRFGDALYNKKDFAILLWGAKVRALGIASLDEAHSIWEEINHRILTEPEKKALKTGFEAKF